MAVHFCISNPCTICYPKYAKHPSELYNWPEYLETVEPKCDCNAQRFGGRHSLWCVSLQWHFKLARHYVNNLGEI